MNKKVKGREKSENERKWECTMWVGERWSLWGRESSRERESEWVSVCVWEREREREKERKREREREREKLALSVEGFHHCFQKWEQLFPDP